MSATQSGKKAKQKEENTPPSSLLEIEKTISKMWLKRAALLSFLDGESVGLDAKLANAVDKDRLELYWMMLNHSHHDVVTSIYPLCVKVLGRSWAKTVDHFLELHRSRYYRVNSIGEEFPQFARDDLDAKLKKRFPYLSELAEYEWLELEMVELDQEPEPSALAKVETEEHFRAYGPILNPALTLRTFAYPIIKLAEQLESTNEKACKVSPAQTHAVIYRDPDDNLCRFLEVGPVAFAIIEQVQKQRCSYADLAALAVSMDSDADPAHTIAEFLALIESLQEKRVLCGNRQVI